MDYTGESVGWLRDNIERYRRELDGLYVAESEIKGEIAMREERIALMCIELMGRCDVNERD